MTIQITNIKNNIILLYVVLLKLIVNYPQFLMIDRRLQSDKQHTIQYLFHRHNYMYVMQYLELNYAKQPNYLLATYTKI